jgi:hypothetical protein
MKLFTPLHGFQPGILHLAYATFLPLAVSAGNDYTENIEIHIL